MKFYVWIFLFYLPKRFSIKIKPKFRMMAALQQQLVAAIFQSFFDLSAVGWHIGDICFGMTGNTIKIAELTISDAYIGGVYIAVYLPGDFSMRHLFFAQLICHIHQVQ